MNDERSYILVLTEEDAARLRANLVTMSQFHDAIATAVQQMAKAQTPQEAQDIAERVRIGTGQANAFLASLNETLGLASGVFEGPIQ